MRIVIVKPMPRDRDITDHHLAATLEMSPEDFGLVFETDFVFPVRTPGGKWLATAAARRCAQIFNARAGQSMILLGQKVAASMLGDIGETTPWGDEILVDPPGSRFLVLPDPNLLQTWWQNPVNIAAAKTAIRVLAQKAQKHQTFHK